MNDWKAPMRSAAQANTGAPPATHDSNRAPLFSASRAMTHPAPPLAQPGPRPSFAAALRSITITSTDGTRSTTFIGHHDVARTPGQGKVRIEPHPLTSADVERATALVAKGTPNSESSLSVLRRYDEFRKANPAITSHGVGILCFCSQQVRKGGVGPGAARNMAKELLTTLRTSMETIENCPLVNAMLLGLEREYAEIGAKHAVDITEAEALEFLSHVNRVDVRAALWLILTCGARVADLLRLEVEQLFIDLVGRRLRIVFKVTKNRTMVSEKYDVSFPFMTNPDAEVVNFLNLGRQLANCDSINYVLKKAKFKFEGGRSITTYSFRRVFEHRVIEWYTDEDGIVEWTKVIAWTQHQDDKALKGHYNNVTLLKVPKAKGTTKASEPPVLPVGPEHTPTTAQHAGPTVERLPNLEISPIEALPAPELVVAAKKRERSVSGKERNKKILVQPTLTFGKKK